MLLATNELMAELTRYRRHYGLAALPYGGETTPLLLPIGGAHHDDTRRRVLDHQTGYGSRTALSDGADRPVV